MPRLFTGLEIPNEIGFALSLKKGGLPGARWIAQENYHITLRYIGNVDRRTAHDVADLLDSFRVEPGFEVQLSHLGVFGGSKPRSLFAAVAPNAELERLQAAQERGLQQMGLPPDGRKFSPHVTLARLRGASADKMARYLGDCPRFEPLRFAPKRFVLFSSRESVGGGPYVVEEFYDFAA